MSKLKVLSLSCMLALAALPGPAFGQYIYIDANGDGVNTSADSLNAAGPTILTIYLNTNHDKDGSLQTCNSHSAASCGATGTAQLLTIFSYQVYLSAMGGTVTWGTFTPDSSAFATLQSQLQDSHDVEFTFSRQPAGSVSPPGLLSLGKIPVTITSGSPSITFPRYPNTPLDPNSFGTVFGTNCAGFAFGNTYVLGDPADPCGAISGVPGDWFDADGVLGPVNNSPTLSAPESASGEEGSTLATIVATATDPDATNTLTITQTGMPTDLEFSTTPGPSPCSATIVGTPGIDDAGEYTITWTVHDGVGGSANSTTVLTIQNGGQAPLVSAPVSAGGLASAPIGFIITAGAPNGKQVTGMGAASLPQGATFVPGLTAGEARFDWAPEPDQLGSYEVTFTASNATGSDSVTTSITVISPDGPRRPWVAPALRRIGQGRGEHLLTRTGDGRTY